MDKKIIIDEIRKIVNKQVDISVEYSDDEFLDIIKTTVFNNSDKYYLSISEKIEIVESVFNSIKRLDILQPLIDDKTITEIMVNGYDEIFIERNGEVIKIEDKFENSQKLEDIIQRIVGEVNRAVNESSPIVDARLTDGSRVSVVLPPIALKGPTLTIRKFPEKAMSIKDLIDINSITEEVSIFLKNVIEAKYNIFISGGTSSGKTSFLNALSGYIPKSERVITIEDSAELQIIGVENLVSLETRNANTENKGEIDMKRLIKTSLRMRPERIIVGEVRGGEALDMLQAMNTGHDGSLSTGHANSSKDMLNRLETMVLSAANIPIDAIRKQIVSAVDIIIQLGRLRDRSRKTLEISEVIEYKDGDIVLNPIFKFEEDKIQTDKKVAGKIKRTKNKMINIYKFKAAGLDYEP